MTKEQYFVRAGEICGQLLGIDVRSVYDMRRFMETAGERLGQESDYPDAAVLMGKEGMELAADWQLREQEDGSVQGEIQTEVSAWKYLLCNEEKYKEREAYVSSIACHSP